MKCILLAAGYATRLLPLTADRPKALLPVGNVKMIDYIVRAVEKIEEVDSIIVVTNSAFASQFAVWANESNSKKRIVVLDDGTTSNDTRLGAIGDLQFTIEKMAIDDDIFVLAADNLFQFDLNEMVKIFHEKNADVITVRRMYDEEQLKGMGIVSVDGNMRVTDFEEKPANPKSNLTSPALYIYKKEDVKKISHYLKAGRNPDSPGNLVPYMVENSVVYAYEFSGVWYDIGTHKSYNEINEKIASGEIVL